MTSTLYATRTRKVKTDRRDARALAWPGMAISLAVFGFNMLGDALQDVLDPRLRGVGGRVR